MLCRSVGSAEGCGRDCGLSMLSISVAHFACGFTAPSLGVSMWRSAVVGWLLAVAVPGAPAQAGNDGWPTYGGDAGGQRYSTAKQIDRHNVMRLHPVWTYHTHALDSQRPGSLSAAFETTPVLFHGSLYLTTPFGEIIALDPATGAERWRYQLPLVGLREGEMITSRGVATWDGGGAGECAARVFTGSDDGQLVGVDAATGRPCEGFGEHGRIDLKAGLTGNDREFHVTSAPTVLGNVVVVGSSIPDNARVDMAKGTVRAYDARTGQQVWTWEPIPWGAQQKVPTGAGNVWSTIAADPTLALLYLPTGSASPDYYGGMRPGDGRDADSIVALEANTGRKVWAFQLVHHDLWDYDVPSEPLLFTWHGNVPAVAVTTKMGMVFVLDRRTGTPLFPVEERPVPRSDVEGEVASATQPFSSLPPLSPLIMPTDGPNLERDKVDADFCREQMAGLRYDGMYTPPSLKGSLVFPGAVGGVNWGSAAYDPGSGILYANTNRLPYFVQIIVRNPSFRVRIGQMLARGRTLLVLSALFVVGLILWLRRRKNWNPGWVACLVMLVSAAGLFYGVSQRRAQRLRFKMESSVEYAMRAAFGEDHAPQYGAPYKLYRHPIVDHHGLSCTPGLWGTVEALNLQTGKMAWEQVHGTQVPDKQTGSLSLGGVMVTAGGLVFSAGTREPLLRAYDAATGNELWKGDLPVPAQATPMTYEVNGRQFVVIAAGGHGLWGTKTGDAVVAFGLN
jgi:quinoprotein glucose dehydrogenase